LNMLTTAEIVAAAKITRSAVHERAKARGITPVKVGRMHLWTPDDARKLMLDLGRGWVARHRRESLNFPAAVPSASRPRRKAG
jgi:hypothetical protein